MMISLQTCGLAWHHWFILSFSETWAHDILCDDSLLLGTGPDDVVNTVENKRSLWYMSEIHAAFLMRPLQVVTWLMACQWRHYEGPTRSPIDCVNSTFYLKKNRRKIWLPLFLLSMYVLCLCVCLPFGALQTSSFNIGIWNFDIDTYMWISQNGIVYFFKFLLIFGVIPIFFYYFLYF